MIFVKVGFGFFVEFTLEEALKFINKKTACLMDQADEMTKSAAKIKAHIKLVLEVNLHVRIFFNLNISVITRPLSP